VLSLRPCPAEPTSIPHATSQQPRLAQQQRQQQLLPTQALQQRQQQLALPMQALQQQLLLLLAAACCGWRGRRVRRARACVRCGG
jgi:hypothetical protein